MEKMEKKRTQEESSHEDGERNRRRTQVTQWSVKEMARQKDETVVSFLWEMPDLLWTDKSLVIALLP